MEVSLEGVVRGSALNGSCRAILNLLKATIQYPADTNVKAAKLADEIKFICQAAYGRGDSVGGVLLYVWWMIIEISQCIPPDHPWQDCLVEAIWCLRQQEGTVPSMGACLWRDLPNLSVLMRKLWNDPAEGSQWLVDVEVDEDDLVR